MTRLALVLALTFTCLPAASASLAPPSRERTRTGSQELLRQAAQSPRPAAPEQKDFVITSKTEVMLDGRACRYEDVPAHATVTVLEVAADRRTLMRIHFTTKK
jgi:hypothetical protein